MDYTLASPDEFTPKPESCTPGPRELFEEIAKNPFAREVAARFLVQAGGSKDYGVEAVPSFPSLSLSQGEVMSGSASITTKERPQDS
jgi:hypothetical protein